LDYFIKPVYVVEPFEIVRAVLLIVVTVGIGYLIGIFALSVEPNSPLTADRRDA